MNQILENGSFGLNSCSQFFFFFFKIWLRQSLDIMVTYHHVQYQKKNNGLILRKFSDVWTDGLTDGQTDESDFTGCCTTNV